MSPPRIPGPADRQKTTASVPGSPYALRAAQQPPPTPHLRAPPAQTPPTSPLAPVGLLLLLPRPHWPRRPLSPGPAQDQDSVLHLPSPPELRHRACAPGGARYLHTRAALRRGGSRCYRPGPRSEATALSPGPQGDTEDRPSAGHSGPGSQRHPAVGHRGSSAFCHPSQGEDAVSVVTDPGARCDTGPAQLRCVYKTHQGKTAELPWVLPSPGRRHEALTPRWFTTLSTHRERQRPSLPTSVGEL